ncbi:S1 family peptidase [Gandjariella thermophila]|nr:serine protease [Gandjariella thermophila]
MADTTGTALAEPAAPAGGGHASPRIVGGTETSTERYPWAVELTTDGDAPFCGGTLVAARKVVTAAHCVTTNGRPDPASSVRVVAGRTDMRSTAGSTVDVTRIWVHPRFTAATQGFDVAVLTLADALPYRTLPLVAAGDTASYRPGTMATVLGWGRTGENEPQSSRLRSVTVPIVADADCARAEPDFKSPAMVCAGDPRGGRDACLGDSGGPMVVDGRLVGLVSWGEGCGRPGKPGVYARLATYHDDVAAQVNG